MLPCNLSLNFAAADAHFSAHPLSAGELAVEAETAPEGGNDYSIRECVITFSLFCMLSQPVECHIFVCLICKMRKKHISQLWVKMTRVLCIFLDLNASVCHVKQLVRTGHVQQNIKCHVGCVVWLHSGKVYIMFPIHQTLWRKQTQLLLAIDTFAVRLCWAAIVCILLLVHFKFCLSALKIPATFFPSQQWT